MSQEILEPKIPQKPKEPPAAVSCLDGKTMEIGCVMACFRGKNTEGFSEEIGNTCVDGWRDIRPSEYGDLLIFVDDVQYDEDTVQLKSNWQATVHDKWSQVSMWTFLIFHACKALKIWLHFQMFAQSSTRMYCLSIHVSIHVSFFSSHSFKKKGWSDRVSKTWHYLPTIMKWAFCFSAQKEHVIGSPKHWETHRLHHSKWPTWRGKSWLLNC